MIYCYANLQVFLKFAGKIRDYNIAKKRMGT